MMAGKGALEAGQRPENQVEDPEGEGDETCAGDQANHDTGHAHTCSTVRMYERYSITRSFSKSIFLSIKPAWTEDLILAFKGYYVGILKC
jgi:hypothetical protein